MTHKLRVTIEPNVVREVDDSELVDLARQGLIDSYEKTDAAADVLSAHGIKAPSKKWADAKKGEATVAAPADLTTPPADAAQKGE